MTIDRYPTAQGFRRALELRLNGQARQLGLPLDRLRKEAALVRLLARIVATAPQGGWALKGGLGMLARLGPRGRATADADATWRGDAAGAQALLAQAADHDLGDHFEFLATGPKALRGESPEGGLRFGVDVRLAGRLFERVNVDISVLPADDRPLDAITLPNQCDFAGLPDVVVPTIRIEQQLAEKLHAYTRNYGPQGNSRAKDLYDMLTIATVLPIPDLHIVRQACQLVFTLRDTTWPPELAPPPATWAGAWRGFVADYQIGYADLEDADHALRGFWAPVVAEQTNIQVQDPAHWDATRWSWQAAR